MSHDTETHLTFSHQAMSTSFEIWLSQADHAQASQAVQEAFRILDRLEQGLSRFVANSDISRLNLAPVGDSIVCSPEVWECLAAAQDLCVRTHGAFDITLGAGPRGIGLDRRTMTAVRLDPSVQVDLGAIGKGFALDRMAEVLGQWQITKALLHSGASTALALDGPADQAGWSMQVSCPLSKGALARFTLHQGALSCSAQVQTRHILDPRTGLHPTDIPAAWALARTGTCADALSTAFLVMGPAEVAEFCANDPAVGAILIRAGDREGSGPCRAEALGLWPSSAVSLPCPCASYPDFRG